MGSKRKAEPPTCTSRGKHQRKGTSAAAKGAKEGRSPTRPRKPKAQSNQGVACPGCLQPFTSIDRTPLCVPACGHALCQQCCGGRRRKCGDCTARLQASGGQMLAVNRLAQRLLFSKESSQPPESGAYYVSMTLYPVEYGCMRPAAARSTGEDVLCRLPVSPLTVRTYVLTGILRAPCLSRPASHGLSDTTRARSVDANISIVHSSALAPRGHVRGLQ